MDIGEYEVLPDRRGSPRHLRRPCHHATDPRRRLWHWLGRVKEMGFSGVNNFPTHTIIDGHFRGVLEETGMGVKKEFEMIALAHRMDLFTIVYVATPDRSPTAMAEAGSRRHHRQHVGTTVGGSIGVTGRRLLHGRRRPPDPSHHRRRAPGSERHLLPQPWGSHRHSRRRRLRQSAHRIASASSVPPASSASASKVPGRTHPASPRRSPPRRRKTASPG